MTNWLKPCGHCTRLPLAKGYYVERRRFGFFGQNLHVDHSRTNWVVVRDLSPQQVTEFLRDVYTYFGTRTVQIQVDDRGSDAALNAALTRAGCSPRRAQIYLAHVGPVPSISPVAGLTIEPVTPGNLIECVVAKLKAFADSEAEPSVDDVQEGTALRRAEMAARDASCLLEAEVASVIAWYDGADRFVFLLGTRVPFRGRAIAKGLLCHALADAYARGCRSVIINAVPEDTPVRLYRRLGFVDETYWRRLYLLEPERASMYSSVAPV